MFCHAKMVDKIPVSRNNPRKIVNGSGSLLPRYSIPFKNLSSHLVPVDWLSWYGSCSLVDVFTDELDSPTFSVVPEFSRSSWCACFLSSAMALSFSPVKSHIVCNSVSSQINESYTTSQPMCGARYQFVTNALPRI